MLGREWLVRWRRGYPLRREDQVGGRALAEVGEEDLQHHYDYPSYPEWLPKHPQVSQADLPKLEWPASQCLAQSLVQIH